MKWRCTWCGKPHEENDPPCDNCGHNAFEEAVVRDESGGVGETGTVDTGTQYLWICADCGRQHMRNNPPCSRCGSHALEKTEQNYEDVERELETPSWLEVAKPYLPAFAVIGIVALLFATGIVPLSVLPGIGPPPMPDAPGNASEASGIDLEDAEVEIHDRLQDERNADARREYDDALAAAAEYRNRELVAVQHGDAERSRVSLDDFGAECTTDLAGARPTLETDVDAFDDEADLATEAAASIATAEPAALEAGYAGDGIDVHVVDGTVYVAYLTC